MSNLAFIAALALLEAPPPSAISLTVQVASAATQNVGQRPREGAFGLTAGQLTFALLPEGPVALRVQEYSKHTIYHPEADGTYGVRAPDGTLDVSLIIVDQDTIEFVKGATRSRWIRTGEYQAWTDQTVRQIQRQSDWYAQQTAALQAQQAAQQAAQAASQPEPEPVMGAAFLDDLRGMSQQAQAEVDRTRRELDRTIARAEAQNRGGGTEYRSAPPVAVASPAPPTSSSPPSQSARSEAQPVPMLAWCWAHSPGDNKILYSSQMGTTQRWIPGDRVSGDPSTSWSALSAREFSQQISGPHNTPLCYARETAGGHSYQRQSLYDGSARVVEIPWAPR